MARKRYTKQDNNKFKVIDVGSGNGSDIEAITGVSSNDWEVYRADIDKSKNPDILWDMTQPLPNQYIGYFDMVIANHSLEHVEHQLSIAAIKNLIRLAKIGGVIFVIVPSLEWATMEVMRGRTDSRVMLVLFGNQINKNEYHKSAYTIKQLRDLFELTGCVIVRQAFRQDNTTRHGKFEFESQQNVIIVEKVKEVDDG